MKYRTVVRDLRSVRLRHVPLRDPHDRAGRPALPRGAREGRSGGGLQHVPAAVGGRHDRLPHRLGHLGPLDGPVGGLRRGEGASAAQQRRVPALPEDAPGRVRLPLRAADPPGARGRAHPQPDPHQAGPARARQHVLHDDEAPPGDGGRRLRRHHRRRGPRPGERLPLEGQHRHGQAPGRRRGARRGEHRVHLVRALGEHGWWPARVDGQHARGVCLVQPPRHPRDVRRDPGGRERLHDPGPRPALPHDQGSRTSSAR